MAFKHLDSRQVTDAQWDHVESLGVKNSYGNKFNRDISHMTVDRERGYCLVRCGATHPRGLFEDGSDREIYFYALCLDNNAFYFDVEEKNFGKVVENNFEVQWNIERIKFPDGWSFDSISVEEFKQIVTEAFTAETLRTSEPGWVKNTNVVFLSDFETKN